MPRATSWPILGLLGGFGEEHGGGQSWCGFWKYRFWLKMGTSKNRSKNEKTGFSEGVGVGWVPDRNFPGNYGS